MKTLVIEITCNKCNHKFKGYINEKMDENKSYLAECSKCKNHVFFKGKQEVLSHKITPDAVKIMFVEIL